MLNREIMMESVYSQLAVDYNCAPGDFLRDGIVITEARALPGRRPFPWRTPRLEMLTFGRGVVVNASGDILPRVREQLEGKTREEAFYAPLIYGLSPYFLPDAARMAPLPFPQGFDYSMVESAGMDALYGAAGFTNALGYDINAARPDMLATVAMRGGEVAGVAGASADCAALWQIGVDVRPPYRGIGLAAALVNMLALEVLRRGFIPYYGADGSNIPSQRVAIKAGFMPAWAHSYRMRPDVAPGSAP